MKELFTWQQMLPSISQAPDTGHHQNIETHPCCWKLSAVRAPPALTALLAPIHFSLSLLCVHTFLVRTRCFEVFSHWEMSSKNLVLPHTHERTWNTLLFLMLAAVQWSQRWPQWRQEWENREQQEAVPVSWTITSCLPENIQHYKWGHTKI